MKNNRLVIVGLGRIGSETLRRLSREFEITCITQEAAPQKILAELKREDVHIVPGDATSRLVLEKARVDEADAVIITTTDEKINTEVATVLMEHFDPKRVISVAFSGKEVENLEGLGVEVIDVHASSATGIRNLIEQKAKAAHAIGLGKEEILEVEVHPNSRLANKRLDFINPLKWRVGIIYREGNIIVPKPSVVLKPKDKVVILGDPSTLKTVSEIITFDFQKFPLQYGSVLIACMCGDESEKLASEINYLFSTFSFDRMFVVHRQELNKEVGDRLFEGIDGKKVTMKQTSLPPKGALLDAISESGGKPGLIAMPGAFLRQRGISLFDLGKKRFMDELLGASGCPVLIARGTVPYQNIVVPCIEGFDIKHSFETAVELSTSLEIDISALLVSPSEYIEGEEEMDAYDETKKTISSISMAYKIKFNTVELNGNPIRETLRVLGDYSLIVAGAQASGNQTILSQLMKPDVAWHILRKSPISVLLLPPEEETL